MAYKFTLQSSTNVPPAPNLVNGWSAHFYPLDANSFSALNVQLSQIEGWFTEFCGVPGSTGRMYELMGGNFNNFGGFPVSYSMDMDKDVGPSLGSQGLSPVGPSLNSSLIFGNNSGFLQGTFPETFNANESTFTAPYTFAIQDGQQAYRKSNPKFVVPYYIYDCPGTWSIDNEQAVCSTDSQLTYGYNNVGQLAIEGTLTQALPEYTAVGYCLVGDGHGTITVFTDTNGSITTSTINQGNDNTARAYINTQLGSDLPADQQGYMKIISQGTYEDQLRVTSAFDGVLDYGTLPQEVEERVTWSGLIVQSTMSSSALYYITTVQGEVVNPDKPTGGPTTVVVPISLDLPGTSIATVHYATADGTAIAGTDYTSASGTVTFPIGTTQQYVTLTVSSQARSGSYFYVDLSGAEGATLWRSRAAITIV